MLKLTQINESKAQMESNTFAAQADEHHIGHHGSLFVWFEEENETYMLCCVNKEWVHSGDYN